MNINIMVIILIILPEIERRMLKFGSQIRKLEASNERISISTNPGDRW